MDRGAGDKQKYPYLIKNLKLCCKKKRIMQPFAFDLTNEDIKREKNKARELRKTQWWKRRCAKGICFYCQKKVFSKELTMDHVVPVSRGGKSTKGNVVCSCKECNNIKKQMLPVEWALYLDSKKNSSFDK